MKRFLLALICAIFSTVAFGQTAPADIYGQMFNLSNTYYGTYNGVKMVKDTANGGTVSLQVGVFKKNGTTFTGPYLWSYSGRGTVTLEAAVYRVGTLTPTITVTPQQSIFDSTWAQIPGTTIATLSPTSRTVPLTTAFNIATSPSRNYRLLLTVIDTCSVHADYLIRPTLN
jgi:hypothetical protein